MLALFAALAMPTQLAAQEQEQKPRYTVIDLGTLGGSFSQAFGVNNKGWVVGFSTLPGDTALHAFLWRKGLMADLGTLAGSDTLPISQAVSLNDRGEVVGLSETSLPDPLGENFCGDSLVCLPVLWQGSVITPLPILGGTNGVGNDINNRGQVVGVAENATPDPTCIPPAVLHFKPAIWDKGKVQELPTFLGDPDGLAVAINDNGQAVGNTVNCSFSSPGHAALWRQGKVTDMGNLGDLGLSPSDINNQGQVVGTAGDLSGAVTLAFLWQNGVASSLGTLPGDVESHANSINDKGQVIGQSCAASGFPDCSVFIWQNGVMRDLNNLTPADSPLHLVDTGRINSLGQIVGLAIEKNTGAFLAFLATSCGEKDAHSEGCEDRAEGKSAAGGEISQRPKVALSENARKLLRQRIGPAGIAFPRPSGFPRD